MKKAVTVPKPQMSPEAFLLDAIDAAKKDGWKCVVSWQFNKRFREYFGDTADPVATTTQMRKDGTIAVFLRKGGASFYRRADLEESTCQTHDEQWAKRDAEVRVSKTEKKPPSPSDLLQQILKGDN